MIKQNSIFKRNDDDKKYSKTLLKSLGHKTFLNKIENWDKLYKFEKRLEYYKVDGKLYVSLKKSINGKNYIYNAKKEKWVVNNKKNNFDIIKVIYEYG